MKFTNGYWLTKPEFDLRFAIQAHRMTKTDHSMTILCPTVPVEDRGDILNSATLTVTFSSPMPDVIRVKIEHFKGVNDHEPKLELNESPVPATITETPERFEFKAGRMRAVVSRAVRGWRVSYFAGDRLLTESEYHAMAYAFHKRSRRGYMIDSLNMDVGEKVYGLGERFTPYVKNGQVVDTWLGDGGTASELAYKCVPFYMTNRGYGVLVESSKDVSFEVGSEKVERVQFSLPGESLTYDVIAGDSPKDVLSRFTLLTGRPALPPAWSFGLWLSTSFTTNYDEKTVNSFIDGMAKRAIPLRVFHFDCYWMKGYNWCDFTWDEETFPDPRGMLARLKARGLKICCWINPYIAQNSPMFDEGMKGGFLIKKANGDVWQTDMWVAGMGIVDVTNPEAREWYLGKLKVLLDMGVDCFKTDFGERIPVRDITWHDGSDALPMHNHFTYLYNKMVFELLVKEKGASEAVVFARSATIGGQKFPVHWNGDSTASFASMAETLRSGLSISHTGFGFWSHDISGFEQTAPASVYKRWAAFGLLSSHSRLHGSTSYRVPWLFDDQSVDVVRFFTKLKCKLMPYLYAAAVEAHETGVPMLRPMILEFPDDIACENLDTQYMLGESILVAPVFHEDNHVDYYLPKGKWTNLLTGDVVEGGGFRRETHGFMTLPLMVRENSVIPMGSVDDRPDYDYADGVTLHLFEPKDASREILIPNQNGGVAAKFTLNVNADDIAVDTDSPKPYKVVSHRG